MPIFGIQAAGAGGEVEAGQVDQKHDQPQRGDAPMMDPLEINTGTTMTMMAVAGRQSHRDGDPPVTTIAVWALQGAAQRCPEGQVVTMMIEA
jgi:hypothetical protein